MRGLEPAIPPWRPNASTFDGHEVGIVLNEDDGAWKVVVEVAAESEDRVRLACAHVWALDAVKPAIEAHRVQRWGQVGAMRALGVDDEDDAWIAIVVLHERHEA